MLKGKKSLLLNLALHCLDDWFEPLCCETNCNKSMINEQQITDNRLIKYIYI